MKMNRLMILLAIFFTGTSNGWTQETKKTTLESTLDDQQSVELTVYNQNMGLVKDTRSIKLPLGQEQELRFMDVAAFINPVTVHIKSLSASDDFTVLEQNYEYDLISPQKLMDKYVGKDIKIIDWNQYRDKKEEVRATLLSNNNGEVYKINNEIYIGHPGYKVLPEIPENLISKPTLTWLYTNKNSSPRKLEVSYLTDNINWKADYVLAVNETDTKADLSGWVTLDNKSGATYKNAKLKLVAGEVNRVQPGYPQSVAKEGLASTLGMKKKQFIEQSFFEYHIYDLQRKTTIKDNQTKQVNLLEANDATVSKELIVRGQQNYYLSQYSGQTLKSPVEVFIKFKNSENNHLGMPLPAGVMRLYKKDQAGSLQFIGEDKIDHTPKDEEVKLKIGEAFDVVAERVQTDFKILTSNVYETAWRVTLRNHKKEDITMTLLEPMGGDWEILEPSHPFEKKDAFTAQFKVNVPKDQEVKVTYRVRIRWF